MEHYVTLFDSLFLPQGLTLHMSMERHIKDYTLWIICVDDVTYEALIKLQLPNVQLLQLSKLENEELLRIKPNRSKGEYCWTLTPFAPRFVFEADHKVNRITYLDADLWFRKHPQPIFDEFENSGKNVLITDHAYDPIYDQSNKSGQYCVQFMIFCRDRSEVVRKLWEEQCIEWCYARYEDGKFGDQKYLDSWPYKFSNDVHVLNDESLLLAPWNSNRFPYGKSILWHFHGLRIITGKYPNLKVVLCEYPLLRIVYKNIYEPYLYDLLTAIKMLGEINIKVRPQTTNKKILDLLYLIKSIILSQWGIFFNRTIRIEYVTK